MYSRREKIKRVREVIEKLENTALRQISKAELDVHKALSDVLDAVNYEAHKILGKLEQSREFIKELIESLSKLQMQDLGAESPNIFHELCMKKDVRLTDEMFTCVQFAMDCESDDMKRGAKGWWKQMVNVRMQIPESLACLARDRSFCAGCQRQTSTLGSLIYRRIPLPCGHYFHNRDCLVLYMTSASRGFYYSKPIYRCPECWSILDADKLMPDLAKKGRSAMKCCICNRPEGELFKRKQPGHYLCEVCADMGGLADCRCCPCGKTSIYSEDRTSLYAE